MRFRKIKIALALAAAVVAVAVLAAWLLLRSASFHRYLLHVAQQQASASLGNQVRIGAFALHAHGFTPRLDAYNLTIAGAPPFQDRPLLAIPHLHVVITIASLLHRQWFLSDLELDRPQIHVIMDADGRSNLPKGNGKGRGGTSLWALGIRHAVVRGGMVQVQDQSVPLDADLQAVHLEARFNPALQQYTGEFGYQSGLLRLDAYNPIPHALSLQFAATPRGLEAPSIHLASQATRLDASLSLQDWSHPRLSGRFTLALDAAQARQITRIAAIPTGQVALAGQYQFTAPRDLIVSGGFSSRELQVTVGTVRAPVRALRGQFKFANDDLSVDAIHGSALGGTFSADFLWRNLGQPRAPASFHAQLDRAQIQTLLPDSAKLGISGAISASVHGGWMDRPQVATIAAATSVQAAVASIPVSGAANLEFRPARDSLTILQSSFHTPRSSFSAASQASGLQLSASSTDLAELSTLADRISVALGRPPLALDLGGAGSLSATLTGTLSQPQIAAQISLAPFAIRGSNWRSLQAAVHASPSALSVTNLDLRTGTTGHIAGSIRLGLRQWSATSASLLMAQVQINGLALAPFESLIGRKLPLAGILQASLSLSGTVAHPVGQGTAALAPGEFTFANSSEPFQRAVVTFQGTEAALAGNLLLQMPAGMIRAQGSFAPASGIYTATLAADDLRLDQLRTVAARNLPLQGAVSLNGSGTGTLKQPAFHLTLASDDLEVAAEPIRQIQMQVDLASNAVTVAAHATTLGTALQANARIGLAAGFPLAASLDSSAIPLAPLLIAYAPALAQQLRGQTAIHATASGPLRSLDQIQAQIELPSLHAAFTPNPAQPNATAVQLSATTPIRLVLANGVLTFAPAHLQGTDTSLDLGGTVPLTGAAPMNLHLDGTVNVALAQAFAPDLSAGGEAKLALAVAGPLAAPAIAGSVALANVSATPRGFPVGLQNGHGTLKFTPDRLDIVSFNGSLGGGTLTATGGVAFQPALRFDLAVAVHQARLRLPPTVREGFSADLTFTGTPEAALLGGRVRVEEVSATPDFDFAKFLSQVASGTTSVTAPDSFARNLSLDVAITTPNQINTVSRDFSLQANANLAIRGSADQPVVLGRVNLTSGDLIFRGDRFVIQSGSLDFANPARTSPTVNLTADTTIQQYDLHLHFQGPADNLKTTYTSDPALPPADIINLLAFGQTTEASSANPAPGNLGAENLLASAVTSQITDRVQRIAGISQLSVDPVLGGGQQNAGARITVQQRVTGNLFITVSTDVTGTQRDVIEIQYKLSPRVSLSAVRDQNGGIGVSTKFKKIW